MGELLQEPGVFFNTETCCHIHGERWENVTNITESARAYDRVRLEFSREILGAFDPTVLTRIAGLVQKRNILNIWLEFTDAEHDVLNAVRINLLSGIKGVVNIYLKCDTKSAKVVSTCGLWVSQRRVVWLK